MLIDFWNTWYVPCINVRPYTVEITQYALKGQKLLDFQPVSTIQLKKYQGVFVSIKIDPKFLCGLIYDLSSG